MKPGHHRLMAKGAARFANGLGAGMARGQGISATNSECDKRVRAKGLQQSQPFRKTYVQKSHTVVTGYCGEGIMPNGSEIVTWIAATLRETGRNQKDLAGFLGLDPGSVSRLLRGERDLRVRELQEIARFLQKKIPSKLINSHALAEIPPRPQIDLVSADLVGFVEAGVFREMPVSLQTNVNCTKNVHLSRDERFPDAPHFALEVADDSFSATIPRRYWAICIPYWSARAHLTPGDVVVVEASLSGRVERSLKRITIKDGRFFLRPEPAQDGPWRCIELDETHSRDVMEPEIKIQVTALVIASYARL